MLQLIELLNQHIRGFLAEIVRTATSNERLKQLLGISLYRNALYLITSNLALPITGFIFWIIAARFYPTEDVGIASAIIAAMGLVVTLSSLGLGPALVRFLPHSEQSASRMINTCFTVASLASIILCGIFLAGVNVWSPALLFLRQNLVYLATFVVFTVASTMSMMVDQTFLAKRRADFTLARGLTFGLLRLPLPILLAAFFHSFGIFASWGISLTVALLLSILFFLPRAQPGYHPFPAISRGVINEIGRFSLANYASILFWLVPGFILPIMVLNLLGAELNAYFYIAWSAGNLPAMIPLAISLSLFAEGSYDEQRLAADTHRSLKLTFLILVPTVMLMVIIADKLLLLFGGSYSENGTMLLRILALSALPIAINYIYLSIKRVQKKLAVIIELTFFIAIATLALSYVLLPQMGINGVGIAWLGSQGMVAVVIVISFISRRLSIRKRLRHIRAFL